MAQNNENITKAFSEIIELFEAEVTGLIEFENDIETKYYDAVGEDGDPDIYSWLLHNPEVLDTIDDPRASRAYAYAISLECLFKCIN